MAFKKLTTEATVKTHGEADATIIDVLLPTVPLADTTGNLVRGAAHVAIGYFVAKKQFTGAFFA